MVQDVEVDSLMDRTSTLREFPVCPAKLGVLDGIKAVDPQYPLQAALERKAKVSKFL